MSLEPRPSLTAAAVDVQERYHHALFGGLRAWERAFDQISDLSGAESLDGLLGLDQMGHFGPNGCDLVVDAIAAHFKGMPLRLCELGSGFGGTTRYVVNRLRARGISVEVALGLEFVAGHCRLFRTINRSLRETAAEPVCAAAQALPLAPAAFDVIFAAGAASHLSDMAAVLDECRRCLRPGGLLVFTEEVSLVRPGAVLSDRFLEAHPPAVFQFASRDERLNQLCSAKFRTTLRDLTPWAIDLVGQRLRALRLFRGSAQQILGSAEVDRVFQTLETALDEYVRGSIQPALIEAIAE
jgi:SAM-dependent methyltransferase